MSISRTAPDVLLFIEHVDREMNVAAAVANVLESRHGLHTEIRSLIFDSAVAAMTMRPRVVVTPSLAFGQGSVARLFWRVFDDNVGFVNMNWEQFISKATAELKAPKHPASRTRQVQLVWQDDFGEILRTSGVPSANIRGTGRPIAALVSTYYLPRAAELRSHLASLENFRGAGPVIFLVPSTKFASPRHQRTFIESGADSNLMREATSYLHGLAHQLVSWLPELSTAFPDATFVLRPHPSVGVDKWHAMVAEAGFQLPSNVLITKSEDAYQWLVASDVVVSDVSTLLVEAREIGLPTVIIKGHVVPAHLQLPWLEGHIEARSADELVAGLRQGLASGPSPSATTVPSDGIVDTADVIAEVAARYPVPASPALSRKVQALGDDPVRGFGSILRTAAMSLGVGGALVPQGLQPDFFTAQRVRQARERLRAAYGGEMSN